MAKKPKNPLRFRAGFTIGDLKRLVAETDEHLSSYYVDEDTYVARALNRHDPAAIFTGPKGVGKSAILQMVEVAKRRTGDQERVISVKPDDLAFNALIDVDARTPILSTPNENLWLFTSLWNYVLTTEIIRREHVDTGWLEGYFQKIVGDRHRKEQRRLLEIAAEQTAEEVETSLTDKMLRLVSEIEIGGEAAGTGGTISAKLRAPDENRRDVNMLQLVSNVARNLPDSLEHQYHILIDDLDLNWRGGELQNAFLGAMFHSITKLSRTKNIKFCVAMRDYIFNEIHLPERDKLSDMVCKVSWPNVVVRRMVARRFSFMMPLREEDVWQHLFPPIAQTLISSATSGTPREVISLAVEAVEVALHAGHNKVQKGDFEEAVTNFSRRQLADFKGRNGPLVPGLGLLVDVMRGGPKEFAIPHLMETCYKAAEVARRRGHVDQFAWLSHGFDAPVGIAEQLVALNFLMLKDGRTATPRIPAPEELALINEDSWFAIDPVYHAGLELEGV